MTGKSPDIRRQLLDAAATLFLQQDFHRITVREIARQANTSSGMIGYYFKSKHGLFETMIREEYQKFFGWMMQEFQHSTPIGKTDETIRTLQKIHQKMPHMAPFLVRAMTSSGPGSEFVKTMFTLESKMIAQRSAELVNNGEANAAINIEVVRILMICVTLLPALFSQPIKTLQKNQYDKFQQDFASIVGNMIDQYVKP